MNKTLIFQPTLFGHELEYVNHLYLGAVSDIDNTYVFVLPEEFKTKRKFCNWPNSSNITIMYTPSYNKSGMIKDMLYYFKMLNNYIKITNADSVFFINLMKYLPILILLPLTKVKFDGIIYKIYLYEWKSSKLLAKISNIVKYLFLSKLKRFSRIYILNDDASAKYLNKLYHTSVFYYLPDPFVNTNQSNKINDLNFPSLSSDKQIFLHFGGLGKRKGTLEILKAITCLSEEIQNKSLFIFAGRVHSTIYNEFYELVNELKSRGNTNILVFDQFCSFELLHYLCAKTNFILMPYTNSSQSSGLIGYGALHNKPVVGPSKGLVGRIIKSYKLGVALDDITSNGISEFLRNADYHTYKVDGTLYIQNSTLKRFTDIIFSKQS